MKTASIGVMLSFLLLPVHTLATAFWISWGIFKDSFVHPDNSELQWSSLGIISALHFFDGRNQRFAHEKKDSVRLLYKGQEHVSIKGFSKIPHGQTRVQK